MAADASVLSASGLEVRRGNRTVLAGVGLTLERGEVVAVLGPNGAGKSTLLAALAGLLPVTAGQVEQPGRVAAALQAPALARRSALANVEAALAWWGVPRGERKARANAALRAIGVGALAKAPAAGLSGGEQRRVHLARVLAVDPDVLLLDEPFAGLDPAARADLLYDAASAFRSTARGTLIVVHDRAEAWALADRVMILLDGRIAAAGRTREVLDNPPSPEVAAFVGFSGRLEQDGVVRMLRPGHVVIDPGGQITCTVTRRIPLEDGLRLELDAAGGRLVAVSDLPGPDLGATIRVRIEGGATFPTGGTPSTI
ncbi:MAG: thiamine transport system ATP-binding protein [Thermoleophilaceae bacterium]|nr:thiamine transport system ATP-binding protein [Thermoleophilaceae bacterium]